ncbi:Alpha/Beta hydrolase protein [Cercophora samala]|uniref:Alpha/Beta hydrolase protein n=1 Tax=Cercophora samala TaxID=330535 RepID=A0AA40DF97_9PEZI|nr:Alpha/Beta hydrolase protein [Cercophora samala]
MRSLTIIIGCLATVVFAHNVTSGEHTEGQQYEGESLVWTPCPVSPTLDSDHQLECSHLLVPMDQFNRSNNGFNNEKHFNISLIRLRGKNATANGNINILLNPGGPGGSGMGFVYSHGERLNAIVGENFNLLSFDPRGVNSSTPYVKCYPTPGNQTLASQNSFRGTDPYNLTESSGNYWASSLIYTQACKQTMGEHGEYINTPQTAADMNSILDAVGQDALYYWGFSYGTILGQTYATMYPDKAKRVIIDGVANEFDWYTSFIDPEASDDTDKVFYGFVEECIKAGNESCPLAQLAETKEELTEKLLTTIWALRSEPAPVYVDNTVSGLVGFPDVWYKAVFKALYGPSGWPALAAALAPLVQGNATAFFLQYMLPSAAKAYNDYNEPDANTFVRYNDGVSGPARSPSTREELIPVILNGTNNTMFGSQEWADYFNKRSWAIPQTFSFVPERGVRTAHPLLILSTTYDPVCPLISARSANDAFVGSRLVEVQGYGHCSLAVPSDCINDIVSRYFSEGVLPDSNVVCAPNLPLPYFPAPESSSSGASSPVNTTGQGY